MLLICAATGKELAALLGRAAPAGLEQDTGTRPPHAFPVRLRHTEALACLLGVGPINAALSMGIALASAAAVGKPVRAVLNAGLAGAFVLEDCPLCTLCAVTCEIWPEYGLHDGRNVIAEAFSFPLWERDRTEGGPVRDRLTLPDPSQGAEIFSWWPARALAKAPRVTSLTVAGVSASTARAKQLQNSYPGVALENMEGFAVAYACARYGIPCYQWRTVSNKVGPRAAHEKDFSGALQALEQLLPALTLI